jgi:hypothetical protein
MSLGYDIFKRLHDGSPLWMTQAATLEEAKRHLESLAGSEHAEYFIRDATTGEVLHDLGSIASD